MRSYSPLFSSSSLKVALHINPHHIFLADGPDAIQSRVSVNNNKPYLFVFRSFRSWIYLFEEKNVRFSLSMRWADGHAALFDSIELFFFFIRSGSSDTNK